MKQSDQMSSKQGKFALNFKSYTLAILVHVVLLGVIVFNLFWNPTKKMEFGGGEVQPIRAQVIDETILNQELEKLKQEDELKEQQEREKQQNLEDLEKLAEEKKLEIEKLEQEKKQKEELAQKKQEEELEKIEELAKQRELEEEKANEVEKKRLAEEARLKELALQKEEEEKKKKLEEEKRKKEEAEKKRKLAEEKKKQEALAQKKREEEKRKKAEAEKKRKAKQEADRIAAEQAQARSQAAALFAQYIGPIRAKVTNSWIRPGTVRPGARARVLVRVSPQGDVLTATMQQGSGDPIFDRSVINAVYKASPLPIPNDARLYPHYRDFVFNFDPPG